MDDKNGEGGGIGLGLGLVLTLVFIIASCSACGYGATVNENGLQVGDPRVYAQATGVARAADLAREGTTQAMMYESTRVAAESIALATREAAEAQATATVAAAHADATAQAGMAQLSATRTAMVQSAIATATAAPSIAAMENDNRATFVASLRVVLVIASLCGLAIAAILRRRAKTIPRGADGQLPGLLINNAIVDPSRMIGAARMPGSFETFAAWTIACLGSRHMLPYPNPAIQLADGGADADHLLEAARVAGHVGVASATFRPDNTNGRKDKLELLHKHGDRPLLGVGQGAPMTRVIVTGDSAIEQIARQLGDRLPLPSPIQPANYVEPSNGETLSEVV